MNRMYASGGSDDLIEIGGDFSDEYDTSDGVVIVNNVPLLRVQWDGSDDGTWVVTQLRDLPDCTVEIHDAVNEDEHDFHPVGTAKDGIATYSQVAVVLGSINNVECADWDEKYWSETVPNRVQYVANALMTAWFKGNHPGAIGERLRDDYETWLEISVNDAEIAVAAIDEWNKQH